MKYLISHFMEHGFYFPNMSVSDYGEFRFIEIENLGEWILQNSATYDIMIVSVSRPDLPAHRIILDAKGRLFRTR